MDLRGVAKCSNVSLASSLFSSSFSFLSHLGADVASLSRDSLSVARMPALSTKSRSGSMRGLKCLSNAMPSSILLVFRARYFLRIGSLVFSISLAIFFTLAHICHVRFWLSIDKPHYDIANPIKSISISFICERTVFIYHYEFIFLLSTIVAKRAKFVVHVGIHVIIVNVFQVGIILFKQDLQVRVVTYQMFRSSSDRDRSS